MSKVKAVNKYLFVIRDEVKEIKDGLILPSSGQVKPSSGTVFSVGKLVSDPDLRNSIGRTVMFHATVGQEIEYDGDTFTVLPEEHILGIV